MSVKTKKTPGIIMLAIFLLVLFIPATAFGADIVASDNPTEDRAPGNCGDEDSGVIEVIEDSNDVQDDSVLINDLDEDVISSVGDSRETVDIADAANHTPDDDSDDIEIDAAISDDVSVLEENQTTDIPKTAEEEIIAPDETLQTDGGLIPMGEVSDVDVIVTLTDSAGNIIQDVNQYTDIIIRVGFTLPENSVNAGDTTTVVLPVELKILDTLPFNVVDNSGVVIATAHVDTASNTLTLVYTDYVETHYDISGSVEIKSQIDQAEVSDGEDFDVVVGVGTTSYIAGHIHYVFIPDDTDVKFNKYVIEYDAVENSILYTLCVNVQGDEYTELKIYDELITPGVSYIEDSFQILEGTYAYGSGGYWSFTEDSDVTSQYQIVFSRDKKSFSVDLGNTGNKQFRVYYSVQLDEIPSNGDIFENKYTASETGQEIFDTNQEWEYYDANGNANGQLKIYAINIHKVNEDGLPLQGAEFSVTSKETGELAGTIVTDETGEGSLSGLTKGNYVITEIKAPDGYEITTEVFLINADDFGSSYSVSREIVNMKIKNTDNTGDGPGASDNETNDDNGNETDEGNGGQTNDDNNNETNEGNNDRGDDNSQVGDNTPNNTNINGNNTEISSVGEEPVAHRGETIVARNSAPKTGDESDQKLFWILLLLSVTCIVARAVIKLRRQKG